MSLEQTDHITPNELLEDYQAHLQSFADEYQPQGATECHLVQFLADTSWRQNRVCAMEAKVLNHSKTLANLGLHSQRLADQFARTVTQLRDLQKQKGLHTKPRLLSPRVVRAGSLRPIGNRAELRRISQPEAG